MRSRKLKTVLLFSSVAVFPTFAEPLSVITTVSPNPVPLNQQVVFTIELSGDGAMKVGQPELPDMGGYLTFLGSGGTSQNISFINGRMSASKSYTFYYLATREGTFTIPAVKVVYDNKTYESQPITMTVTQGPPPTAAPAPSSPGVSASGENLFLRAIVSRRRVYQNEPVYVTFRLYSAVSVSGYSITSAPSSAGFWVEEIETPQQPQVREEVINGKRYVCADIKKVAFFPATAGEKTIGPMTVQCEVKVPARRSRDPFDAFFSDPFFGRTTTMTVSSPAVTIEALPLPESGKPAEFRGAVGRFQLKAELDRDEATTDDAVTLRVTISGNGNIRLIGEPTVTLPPEFQQYAPNVTENVSRQPGAIGGSKTFEYVMIPRYVGTFRISPVAFAYFDPEAGSYKRLTSPEMFIRVSKGQRTAAAVDAGLSREEVKYVGRDIRYIKTEPGKWVRRGSRPYRSSGFFISLAAPLFLWIGAVVYRRRLDMESRDTALLRSRRANAAARRRLSKAKSLLSAPQQKAFYAEIADALQGFAADKLNLEKVDLISSELEGELRRRGVNEELIRRYFDIIRHCDYQRFAPATSTEEEMKAVYRAANEVIVQLEKAF